MNGREIALKVNELINNGQARTIREALDIIGGITGESAGALYQRMWRDGYTRSRGMAVKTEQETAA